MAKRRLTRRDFIKTTAAGALTAGLGVPLILPGRSHGAVAKNSKNFAMGALRPCFRQVVQRNLHQGVGREKQYRSNRR